MHVIDVRNVHAALPVGLEFLQQHGEWQDSRAGRVLVAPTPVTTAYQCPKERVLFWAARDANPFFHFMEGLWMLAGRKDVAWISQFSSNIAQYSDDGVNFHGAYGDRWCNHFVTKEPVAGDSVDEQLYVPFNQLFEIAQNLKQNSHDRRSVLAMWNPEVDLGQQGKDFPCNTHIYFRIRKEPESDDVLDMTVCNRSNDIIWGAYGANAVHMSMLQEVMAAWIGVEVGVYYQLSNNYHAYENTYNKIKSMEDWAVTHNPYEASTAISSFPIVNSAAEDWFTDLATFLEEGPTIGLKDKFFRKVAGPMYQAWFAYKNKDNPQRYQEALAHIAQCKAEDWRQACTEWLERRAKT